MTLNALDYADLETAVRKASDGDQIYVPGVQNWRTPAGGLIIDKSLEIFGDGPGNAASWGGTTLVPFAPGHDVIVIQPSAAMPTLRSVVLRGFKIRNDLTTTPDGKNGIRTILVANRRVESLRIEAVTVLNMTEVGTLIEGANGTNADIGALAIMGCYMSGCGALGLSCRFVRHARVVRSGCLDNAGGGAKFDSCGVVIVTTGLDGNGSGGAQGQLLLNGCTIAAVEACHFEKFADKPVKVACELTNSGGAASIGGCFFPGSPPASTAIRVPAGNGAVAILPNRTIRTFTATIDVASSVQGCVVLPQFDDLGGQLNEASIIIPPEPNGGLFAAPLIRRPSLVLADTTTGLIMPSLPSAPTTAIGNGTIYYDAANNRTRARVGGAWVTVSVVP